MAKKYVSLSKLSTFLDNLKNTFAALSHKHTMSDITDYTGVAVDSELSNTSTNPVQNKVIDAEFDAMADAMGALELAIDGKADAAHTHDDRYYTETEVNNKLSEINTSITNITSGSTVVKEAEHATSADTATNATNANHAVSADSATSATTAESATKASQDGNGKVIADTYETKSDASAKLTEAKSYADTAANTVKNDLLNGAGEAYDTLKELADLIDANEDAIGALETVATGKADKVHTHAISDVTDLQETLDAKANTDDILQSDWNQTDETKLDYIKNKPVEVTGEDVAAWFEEKEILDYAYAADNSVYTNNNGDMYVI